MRDRRKTIIAAAVAVAALGIGGAAIAGAAGGDDDATEQAITGSALTKASQAALEHTGGGSVTQTEAGDEEGAYEVEVALEDGGSVDVHLDEDFKVLSQVSDDDTGADENESGDE